MKRQRTALPTDPARTNNQTDGILTIIRYMRASALTPPKRPNSFEGQYWEIITLARPVKYGTLVPEKP